MMESPKSHIPTHIRQFTVTWNQRWVGWTKGRKGDENVRGCNTVGHCAARAWRGPERETGHAQTHILRRTSVFKHAWWEGGARGWNRVPIVLRCEACAQGVDGARVSCGERPRERRVDLHTRHEPLQQRDGTDWKPFIHSVALYFFPVFDWESIVDHPPAILPLSFYPTDLWLSCCAPTGTVNYILCSFLLLFFFFSFVLCDDRQDFSLKSKPKGNRSPTFFERANSVCIANQSNICYFRNNA